MNGSRAGVAIFAATAVVATIGVGASFTGGETQSRTAIGISSEALNRQHGLDEKRALRNTTPQWLRALRTRSAALNLQHGLDEKRAMRNTTPQWLLALQIRSDALNRQYKLGEYAPGS